MADNFDNYSMKVQAKSVMPSVKEIDGQIRKLEKSISKLKVSGKFDDAALKNLNNQLNTLKANITTANFSPTALNELTSQVNKALANINIGNINVGNTSNQAQKAGQQIGNNIAQGVSKASGQINSALKSFTDLRNFSELHRSISNFHVDSSELKNYQTILDNVKNTYAEFGQVKITNETFNNGILEKFKVNIEQVNGDLKETKSFMMSLTEDKDAFVFNGLISGSESIVQHLDKTKNAVNQTADAINALKEKAQIDKIQLLSNGGTKNDYSTQIAKLEGNFRSLGLTEDDIQAKTSNVIKAFDTLKARINQPFDENNYQEIISLNDKLQKELTESGNEYTKLQSSAKGFVSMQQRLSKANTIEAWNQKNSAATKQTIATNEAYIASLRDLNTQMTKMQFNEIVDGFKKSENSMRSLGRLGASFKDQMSQAAQSFTQWLSVSSGVMLLISKTREAVSEIKELDNTLTEISKTSDMTSQQLKQLGMDAYDTASKYGRTASDYLLGVQEMARSGFYGEKGSALAEQSLIAQSAGDMNAELANNYILATNAAYKFNGEADKLNAVLDGQNSITNRNSVAMEDMATAMSEAGTVASSYRVSIEDLSAMIGTIESVTKLGGGEVGNAIKAILINLQNVTSDKIVDTLNAANASMTEFVNGAEKLRNPIDILRDLAKTFNQLDEDDPLRAEILTNIGQKYHAAKLGALLQNMEMFDKMLVDYSEGTGSALEESNKSAENLTGTINKLSNSWTEFINTIVKSDGLKNGVKLLDSLVQGATNLVDKLGSLGTIGLGAGLFAGVKNTGKYVQVYGFQTIIC